MGAESFFVIFLDSDSEKKKNREGEFQFLGSNSILLSNFPTTKNLNSKLLRATIFEDSEFFQGISFEGCFSCYEKCLEELESIFNKTLSKFHTLVIFNNKENKKIRYRNFTDIKEYILETNELKYKRYNDIFHGFTIECLPDAEFYKNYRKRNMNRIVKIFRSFFLKN